ncbi:MAG: hypothetical protein WKF77_01280 [Planctomycetaceae bacterium]
MNKTAQNISSSLIAGYSVNLDVIAPASASPLAEVSGLTAAELRGIQDEKLAAIRLAIDKGDYDSDAILEKALGRMLERLEQPDNEQ